MQALQKKLISYKNFRIIKDRGILFNEPFLKLYQASDGTKKYKISVMKCVKNKSVEMPSTEHEQNKNNEKLENNIIRAKSTIYELAFCNQWDFFFTGTLDKTKCSREDLSSFNDKFKKFIFNVNHKYHCKISYLIIPELHSDLKSWHFHGFVQGIPEDRIYQFKIGDKMGKRIAEKISIGEDCFYWVDWFQSFGFNDLEKIRNCDAVSKYVTKYITKDLMHSVKDLNAHSYYCSKNLKRAIQLNKKKIDLSKLTLLKPDFSNEYCSLYWFNENQFNSLLSSSNDNLQQNLNSINTKFVLDT